MNSTQLDLADIQGNVLAGFNTDVEVLIGLALEDGDVVPAGAWLASLGPRVTTVEEVNAQRDAMKARDGARPLPWLCVALGARLIRSLRSDLIIREEAFIGGLLKRSPGALGDHTDPAGWRVGGPTTPVDVFLIVASNDEGAAEGQAAAVVAEAQAAGLRCVYRETARRIEDLEHFGFRDGISQPTVRGYQADGIMEAGHFLFGYPRKPGGEPVLPAIDPNNFMRNGSFLVFRRLAQDVGAFREFCNQTVQGLTGQWPQLSAEHLGALIVGRWPSGAPVSISEAHDPGRQLDENAFDFSSDSRGSRCPLGAHIRKVNPRNGPKDLVDVPRLLRRGIPFGPRYDEAPERERGLAFISFQTSIRNQLETITGSWMNSASRPAPGSGHDLLVGRASVERSLNILAPGGPVVVSDHGKQWITPTGGAYLFVPGRSALTRLNSPRAPAGLWQAQKLIASAGELIRNVLSPQ